MPALTVVGEYTSTDARIENRAVFALKLLVELVAPLETFHSKGYNVAFEAIGDSAAVFRIRRADNLDHSVWVMSEGAGVDGRPEHADLGHLSVTQFIYAKTIDVFKQWTAKAFEHSDAVHDVLEGAIGRNWQFNLVHVDDDASDNTAIELGVDSTRAVGVLPQEQDLHNFKDALEHLSLGLGGEVVTLGEIFDNIDIRVEESLRNARE